MHTREKRFRHAGKRTIVCFGIRDEMLPDAVPGARRRTGTEKGAVPCLERTCSIFGYPDHIFGRPAFAFPRWCDAARPSSLS
jgi:hypothetical protein